MKKIFVLALGILLVGSVFALTVTQDLFAEVLPGGIEVFSPVQDAIYNARQIPINLTMSSEANFFKYADNGGTLRTLCRRCSEYGFSKIKKKPFDDGFHEVTIEAIFDSGSVFHYVNFTVDSKDPRISKALPKGNKFTNGSFFIKYTEANCTSLSLNIINSSGSEGEGFACESGENIEKNLFKNVTSYDGQTVNYEFVIEDIAGNIDSKLTKKVHIDTTSPVLTINLPENIIYGRRVPFNISVSEDVLLEYYDNSDSNPRWRRLCSNCDDYGNSRTKTKSFKRGTHDLLIRAVDDAGNSDVEEVVFDVDY